MDLDATGNTWAIASLLASQAARVAVSNPRSSGRARRRG